MLEHGYFVLALVIDHPGLGAVLDISARLGLATSFSVFIHVEEAMLVTTWCSVLFENCELMLVRRLQNLYYLNHLRLSIFLL